MFQQTAETFDVAAEADDFLLPKLFVEQPGFVVPYVDGDPWFVPSAFCRFVAKGI